MHLFRIFEKLEDEVDSWLFRTSNKQFYPI